MNSFIENLNQSGGDFLNFAWPILWQSSLLIAFVFGLDLLLARKIRASIRYALWLAVLVKLLLPPTLALPTSAAWWLFPNQAAARTPIIPKYVVTYDSTTPLADFVPETIPMPVPPPPKLDSAGWVLLGCGLVSAGLLVWLTFRWWQISRKVSGAIPSEEFASLLDEIRTRAGLRSPPQLKLVSGRMSPAVCGLCRPVILLPRVLAERLSAGQLRAVLLHEAFHLRRKDVWVNCGQALLQIAYWWHPLLWLANARIRRLREEAVDDAVMLALHGEAESYAPTLLAVAKLALSRPLMSLGLVGIMESRTALRKRIERLVDFSAPRKAGLTFLSLCGIFAFSAVALPMGEAPGQAENLNSTDAVAVEQQSLTLKVDPQIFIRNVKAQAAQSLLSPTNHYYVILLDLLRTEGVDCNPPHGIAFTPSTGEITTQNTPDQLEIFRQVIGQLNRADGHCALPLGDNPLRKRLVVIEARIYQMPSGDFDNFVSGLRLYHGRPGGDDWWSASPEKFSQLVGRLGASGLRLIQRPRIQTGSGITAEFFIGNGTNNVEFDCKPYVADGFVDLALQGTVVRVAPVGPAFTNYFSARASAEDRGGIVVCLKNYGGDADNDLVTAIGVEIVTNTARFQERLQRIISSRNSMVTEPRASGQAQSVPGEGATANPAGFVERARVTIPDKAASANGLVSDAKVLYEMGKFDDAETRLKSALTLEPENQAAHYYMNLVQEAKANHQTGMVQTSAARKNIMDKLNRIRFDQFGPKNRWPLKEVVHELNQLTAGLDSNRTGIRFLTADNADGRQPTIDPDTGLPAKASSSNGTDINSVIITIDQTFTNLTLANVLDVIVMTANKPIEYAISADGVVFAFRNGREAPRLYSRVFKLNNDVFLANLRKQDSSKTNVTTVLGQLCFIAGVELTPPKSIFYNDRMGLLFVRATEPDLDKIEKVLATLNCLPPQIHIKARFLEVPEGTLDGSTKIAGITNSPEQLIGILTSENAKTLMRTLQSHPGVEELAEPEVTTTSGRQTEMRSTQIITVITNFAFAEGLSSQSNSITPQSTRMEVGPVLDVVPNVQPDGYTIDLTTFASLTEFLGYDTPPTKPAEHINNLGDHVPVSLAVVLPSFGVRKASAHVKLWDGQTVVLAGVTHSTIRQQMEQVPDSGSGPTGEPLFRREQTTRTVKKQQLLVLITVNLVDAAGNRIHSDDDLPFAKYAIPQQGGP